MIGQAAWFNRRKYGGWGITPKSWQGWVYIAVWIGLIALVQLLPINFNQQIQYIFIAIMMADVIHIMSTLKKDEFEQQAEAIAERNGAWAMIAVLLMGIFFQVYQSVSKNLYEVDPFLLAALLGGALAKSITNLTIDRKGL